MTSTLSLAGIVNGKYQGYFGAVFGVSTVVGPLLGGFFVDHLSWRWIFYVNLPIGVLGFFMAGVFLFDSPHLRKPRGIDAAEFFVSPNPGEELRPLARIVSGEKHVLE